MLQAWSCCYRQQGLSAKTVDIISASWKDSTKRQYKVYIKKWESFCKQRNLNKLKTKAENVLEFLSDLFYNGNAGYSVINTARSALASFLTLENDSHTVGSHTTISRFMRGVFHLRPPVSRYTKTWDVGIVLNYLRKLYPATKLPLKDLTHKLVMLLALTSAQRVQTLYHMNLDKMNLTDKNMECVLDKKLKQNQPGRSGCSIQVSAYKADSRICVIRYLREYLRRTKDIRGQERFLLICYRKPYHRASSQTISRWIKLTMRSAGVNTEFKAHSTRAASTSTAKRMDVPLKDILAQAGWAKENTFQKFYDRPLESKGKKFTDAVLNSN